MVEVQVNGSHARSSIGNTKGRTRSRKRGEGEADDWIMMFKFQNHRERVEYPLCRVSDSTVHAAPTEGRNVASFMNSTF